MLSAVLFGIPTKQEDYWLVEGGRCYIFQTELSLVILVQRM